ncbi:hypothetical protein [Paraburkholderia bannensis]|uniref:hypothetical protein n=1 Tax=Paraburkholderia bannensis TaxID=765414 RepID=UPI00069325D4|nr:hypothetical protein [Paraburkholderia bannensis]
MEERQPTLKAIAAQTAEVTARISRLAGRAVVMQKFIELAMPALSPVQAAEIHQQLRKTLEDVMALMDDALLPPDYHTAFLDKTNELLRELERKLKAGA